MRLFKALILMLNVLVLPVLPACTGRFSYEEDPSKVSSTLYIDFGETVIDDDLILEGGHLRTIVRAYPIVKGKRSASPVAEFSAENDLSDGYDQEVEIQLVPGEYELWAWSDYSDGVSVFYDASDFSKISLIGDHIGSTYLRDAHCGSTSIEIVHEGEQEPIHIAMDRPLARFALVSEDLMEFIVKQSSAGKEVNLDEYTAVIHYVGFMPDTFSLFTDRPVDSSTGVWFTSPLKQLNDSEVLLGFDYVFVTGKDSVVTVRVALLDNRGEQVSLTGTIKVPLKRNTLTLLKGKYMNQESSDWLHIDPDYDGDFNLYI
jgi:hypothetical protein